MATPQRPRTRKVDRLLHVRADALAGTVAVCWLTGLVAVSTTSAARGVVNRGLPPSDLGDALYSGPIGCVRVTWLSSPRPAGLPGHALYLGQSGGTTVLYRPKDGPVRLPSSSVLLVSVDDAVCRP